MDLTDGFEHPFNLEETRDFMPQMGSMVGYAITCVCQPSNKAHKLKNPDAWAQYRWFECRCMYALTASVMHAMLYGATNLQGVILPSLLHSSSHFLLFGHREYVAKSGPGPKIVVVQDLDANKHHVGAFWGEVNRSVFA